MGSLHLSGDLFRQAAILCQDAYTHNHALWCHVPRREDHRLLLQWPGFRVSHHRKGHALSGLQRGLIFPLHQIGGIPACIQEGHYAFYCRSQGHAVHSNTGRGMV